MHQRLWSILLVLGVSVGLVAGWPRSPQVPQPVAIPIAVSRPAAGLFLVATREMPDPYFRRSVVFLITHDDNGTLGLIVNRPTGIALATVLPELKTMDQGRHQLFFGGPVALDNLLFLARSRTPLAQARAVVKELYVSADRATLEQLLGTGQAKEVRLYFGHAGWAPGQLVAELAHGSWRLFQADPQSLFQVEPELLWERFMGSSGQIWVHAYPPAARPVWVAAVE